MNKIKIIDLLNMISKGEEVPKRIKFYGNYYIWYDNEYTGNKGYCLEPLKADSNSFLEINTVYDLNYEVEIIEEKKIPEKLKWNEKSQHNIVTDNTKKTLEHLLSRSEQLKKSINQIVDYLDYLKSKGK